MPAERYGREQGHGTMAVAMGFEVRDVFENGGVARQGRKYGEPKDLIARRERVTLTEALNVFQRLFIAAVVLMDGGEIEQRLAGDWAP
ncbi:MAG: hypothetical protein JNL98_35835 [Bryobacterales bacterium]|nr:hypothetical protein [Bryobacterales bacterium]